MIWFRGDGYTLRKPDALTLDGRRCCDLAPHEDALFMVRGRPQLQRRRPDGFDPVRDDPQMDMSCAGEPVDGVHGEGGGSR